MALRRQKELKMAPPAYQPFFAASMAAAAALLGLLFVAVSVAPERTVGIQAPVERQVVAESVFTALIDAFFLSMAGALPDINLGSVALPLSAFALFQTLHVAWKLWPRQLTVQTVLQRLGLVVVALVIYGLQFRDASQLVRTSAQTVSAGSEIILLFALYAFALGRSWELLGARRGILTGRLTPTLPASDERSITTVARPAPASTDSHPRPRRRGLRPVRTSALQPSQFAPERDGERPSRASTDASGP